MAEQQEGLQVLNLTSNNITQEGIHDISAMLVRQIEMTHTHTHMHSSGARYIQFQLFGDVNINKYNYDISFNT